MCGILGIWGGELGNLKHANDLQSHRGPDDKGNWIDRKKNIFFGHRRLSVLDLTHNGQQPMSFDNLDIVKTIEDILSSGTEHDLQLKHINKHSMEDLKIYLMKKKN